MGHKSEWLSAQEFMQLVGSDNEMAIFDAIRKGVQVGERTFPGEIGHIRAEDAIERLQLGGQGQWIDGKSKPPLTIGMLFFERTGAEQYASDDETTPLTGKERTELGRLRREKTQWDMSINAAVHLTFYVAEKCGKEGKIKRKALLKESKEVFPNLPNSTFERIWQRVPERFKNMGGTH